MKEKIRELLKKWLPDSVCLADNREKLQNEILAALQPAEDELVLNPYECYGCEVEEAEDFHSGEYHAFAEGSEAQLAHDKLTMVKLPSEDRLADILKEKRIALCIDGTLMSNIGIARVLLKLLKEQL